MQLFMSKTKEEIQPVNDGVIVSEYEVTDTRSFWYSCTKYAGVSECKIGETKITPRAAQPDRQHLGHRGGYMRHLLRRLRLTNFSPANANCLANRRRCV